MQVPYSPLVEAQTAADKYLRRHQNIKAPKNGYAYIYVSNESDENVFFDNLQVSHIRGRIIEENHYYAYGLKIAAISSRKLPDPAEGGIKNNNLYNDKELWEEADLNWYDYGFRNYDAQIGRFTQIDPWTDSYPDFSPYHYAGDEPIANIDFMGLGIERGLTAATAKVLENVTVYATKVTSSVLKNVGSFIGGVASGIKTGVVQTINFVANDAWEKDTWVGMGNSIGALAIAHASGGNPTTAIGAMNAVDNTLGSDLGATYGAMADAADKFADNIPNMSAGDWGNAAGQALVAIFGSKGAGAIKNVAKVKLLKFTINTSSKAKKPLLLLGIGALHKHHIFPQQFKKWFAKRGIKNIDDYTVKISDQTHLKGVHGKGLGYLQGKWNQKWRDFIDTNPYATPTEIFHHVEGMLKTYGLDHLPYGPFK